MKHYETMIVVPPTVSETELDAMIQAYSDELKSRHGANETNVQKWGKRNLAYPIQNYKEGYYILCDYTSEKEETVSGFESRLRLSETIIRFLTIRRDDEEKSEARMKQKLAKRGKSSTKEEPGEFDSFNNFEDSDMD